LARASLGNLLALEHHMPAFALGLVRISKLPLSDLGLVENLSSQLLSFL
jgi:hypothetical protein